MSQQSWIEWSASRGKPMGVWITYILDDGKPLKVDDVLMWAQWFGTAERVVAADNVGDARILTVFLGFNHNWGFGDPILWETIIVGGQHGQHQTRYSSLEDAVAGHAEALARLNPYNTESARLSQ